MKRQKIWSPSASAVGVAVLLCSCAHLPPPGLRMREMNFTYQSFRAPSGLQIVLAEDHSAPVVGIVDVVGVGSASDPAGKEGLAHLLEHLTFRARPDGKSQLRNLLTYGGAGDFNAETKLDDTVYYEFGPKESLQALLSVETRRMAQPLAGVDVETFEVERNVVRNELREAGESGDPEEVTGWIQEAVFPAGHPYSHPGGGTDASLSAITLGDVQAFAAAHYRPSNMTVVIAGDVTPDEVEALLKTAVPPELTAAEGTPPRARPFPPAELPEAPAQPMAHHEAVGVQSPVVYLAWPLPRGFDENSAVEAFVLHTVNDVAIRAFFRDDDIVNVSASIEPGEQASLLVCEVRLLKGDHPEKSAEHVLDQIFRIWEPKFTDGMASPTAADVSREFLRRRVVVANELAGELEDLEARAQLVAEATQFTDDPTTGSKALQRLATVTPAELQHFVYRYLRRDQARGIFVAPVGSGRSSGEPQLFSGSATPDAVKVVYPPDAVRLLAHGPGAASFRDVRLENGLRLIVARRPGWPQVSVELALRGGRTDGRVLGAGTFGGFARQSNHYHGDPSDFGVSPRAWQSEDTSWFLMRGGDGNLANLLAMVSDRVRSMDFPAYGMPEMKRRLLPEFADFDQRPELIAARAMEKALFSSGSYGRIALATDLAKVEPDDISDWIERTYDPHGAVLAISGDVDPDEAEALVRDWLGDWKGSGQPFSAPEVRLPADGAPPQTAVIVTAKPNARQEQLQLVCAARAGSPAEAVAQELLVEVLAHDLDLVARQTIGATYGFRGAAELRRNGVGVLRWTGDVENEHFATVLASLHSRWEALATRTISEDDLSRARWALARRYNLSLRTSPQIDHAVIEAALQGWPLGWLDEYPQLLTSVSAEDVRKAAARCQADAALSIVGDEADARSALGSIWR